MVLRRPGGLIIPSIIQTIRLDPSGSDQIDDPSNMSSPDPSGADQIDAEHQATDLATDGACSSRHDRGPTVVARQRGVAGLVHHLARRSTNLDDAGVVRR